ncbi:Cyclohexanecarboxylate-CoA ligase [Cupriavidus necator]|uniref:Cyclohexanecarboxylate-CoA ligase n=1 Tax=Cupriavidus necator TaxID=106590 RepID=A0A1K0JCW5_CUPNE|nr:Cyclohexanecarboxylate-CoA ligase [Cupriavidus necator]
MFNPLMPIFRERELSFMLKHCGAKVAIVPKQFRGFDHEQMLEGLRPNLPALEHVVVVGGGGPNSFEALLSGPQWEREADARAILTRYRPGPDDVTQLMFTSGTTGEPKGVMHTANTMMANLLPFIERMRLSSDDVMLMASPMAHQVGFMYGMMMPVVLRARAVLQDVWDAGRAADLVRAEGCTFTMASTPFLSDLTKTVVESGKGVPSLRIFQCAGAPIPGALVEQAREVLGTKIVSGWGMTEVGVATLIQLNDDDQLAVNTDGCPLPGVEVKVVDVNDMALPAGEEGKLMIRGCSNFGGYLHRPQLNSTDTEGWFDTGDLARMDEHGYIRISGRSKDVIIRGGENIPVVEIEALLYRHPAVLQVALVAYPDERLGERGCAVVTTKPGQSLEFAGMVHFLKSQKVALQYIPERLLVLEAMPSTPSGKIQKFKLREMVRAGSV